VGYNATYRASNDTRIATLAIGYADGYMRAFANHASFLFGEVRLPVIGRISMDLIIVDAAASGSIAEGDWVDIKYNLALLACETGFSQYELLTLIGDRSNRYWS
jgi:alanine racemase